MQIAEAFPKEIAGFQRQGPARQTPIAVAVPYRATDGSNATVFLYEPQQGLSDGVDNPAVADELRMTPQTLNMAVRAGVYRSVTPDVGMDMNDSAKQVIGRCATFKIVQASGVPTGDGVCVSVYQGRLIKVRATFVQPPEPIGGGVAAMAVLTAVRESLSKPAGAPQS
jgi:hypothetical protein